jgi:hypothetical protein
MKTENNEEQEKTAGNLPEGGLWNLIAGVGSLCGAAAIFAALAVLAAAAVVFAWRIVGPLVGGWF